MSDWQRIAYRLVNLSAIPFWLAMRSMAPIPAYDFIKAEERLSIIQGVVSEAAQNGDEVLFITQRHLLTLGMVESVALEPNNEVVELMEMAMSGNTLYLERFYDDLYSHRFAVIVAPPQFTVIKDEQVESFAEENNAWVTKVSEYILCAYEPSRLLKKSDIVLYVPKATVENCQFSE